MFSPYGATKHYGEAIKEELERRGAIVKGYDERPSQNSIVKIVIRLFKKRIPQIFDRYISSVIHQNKTETFDYILICRGEAFTPLTIQHLKTAFPSARVLLYFWDILRCADVRFNIPYADKAMSFDPQDSEENEGLGFRPTFYVKEYLTVKNNPKAKIDVCFIGTLHSNRHRIIKKIEKLFTDQGLTFYKYLYVPSPLVYIKDFVTKFPYIALSEVHFSPISVADTVKVLDETKAVFDINYTAQKSLSTRAYEAMAARRKYITTNPEVMTYDFYNPHNIAVVDLDNFELSKEFINSPFEPIPEEILNHYSVVGLVDDLFGDDGNDSLEDRVCALNTAVEVNSK